MAETDEDPDPAQVPLRGRLDRRVPGLLLTRQAG
jgi:hypothetical protein